MNRSSITMSFIRHLSKPSKLLLLFLAATVLDGCSKEPEKTGYVARVNETYLTTEELNSLIDSSTVSTFYRNEIIRNWIDKEVLFQEAIKEGVPDEQQFNNLIAKSKKELAASLLLENYFRDKNINTVQAELVNYYNKHADEFTLTRNSYLLNIIHFRNEDRAAEFRALLLDSDWKRAQNVFFNDSTIISFQTRVFIPEQDIYSEKILRIVKRLHPLEISIVISEREGYYSVVQVLEKYPAGSIPVFDVIKNSVEKRLVALKRKEMIESYIKNLYSNYEIEVKN